MTKLEDNSSDIFEQTRVISAGLDVSFSQAFICTFLLWSLHFQPALKSAGPNMVCEPLPGIESEQWIVTMAVGSAGSQWRLCSGGRSWSPDTERAPVSVECFAQVAAMSPPPPATVTGGAD